MGLLDRLLRGRRTPEARDTRPLTPDQAMARWRYLLARAPPDALGEAHARGLDALGDMPRAEMVQRLRTALLALEPGVMVPSDAGVLARAAAKAERRAPGFLERALASDARGRQTLGSLALAVVTSSAAAPFLRDFGAGLDAEEQAEGVVDLEVDAAGHSSESGDHDGELDDED